ncbi:hypothetical protein IQ250_26155 [Pseudanabaenaceae cyanobacterium LEGE 13415]|nr:hypothetical protein [Pseudanabaenaceae cyanobacterium LEGE 13415]
MTTSTLTPEDDSLEQLSDIELRLRYSVAQQQSEDALTLRVSSVFARQADLINSELKRRRAVRCREKNVELKRDRVHLSACLGISPASAPDNHDH